MFGLFRSNPVKKLQKQYEQLLEEAMILQRNGDIKNYSMTATKAEKVREELERLKEAN